jgi:endonuclease/exonuclease/phosphatase family metal-dependent hydrolase
MRQRASEILILLIWSCTPALAGALSVLTYNVGGNGTTDWSTNAPQVQALGRQMSYLQPDIVTFNEIPFTNSWQMTNFVRAYLPGYALAMNSGTDGYIRSAIASRYAIRRSQKWLDGVGLTNFGYNGRFTRDLFEAEIAVPGFAHPLHAFTTHLKAGTGTDDLARRAAEASAISNFLVASFLPSYGHRPYLLAGDLNEDINRPPGGASGRPIQRLISGPTGLRLTTPRNPVNNDDRTLSIRSSLFVRYDYILPGGLLFSNIATSQVFRTDLLNPAPTGLGATDSRTASDHLPVLMIFNNPFDGPFRVTSLVLSNGVARVSWQATAGRQYRVEATSNLVAWSAVSGDLTATTTNLVWTTSLSAARQFYRVYRLPSP